MENISDIEDSFKEATFYVRNVSGKLDASDLLFFYSRYKQANEGPCNTSKPGFFDFQGKQKWDAWNKLGSISREEAMYQYVTKLTDIEPNWNEEIKDGTVKKSSGLGLAVSTMANDDIEIPDEEKTLFDWIKEGDFEHVSEMISQNRALVNEVDEMGMTPLHWACDRGSVEIVGLLLGTSVDANFQDTDGQTPLHYAVSCEHIDVVRLLLQHGVDCSVCDNDGCKPECDSKDITDMLNQYR